MPRLLFDFPPGPGASPVRRIFREPVEEIRANDLKAVLPALEQIRRGVLDQGLSAAGYLSYEAAPAFDPAFRVRSGTHMPLLWFGLFEGTGEPAASPPPGATPSGTSDRFGPWELDVSREAFSESVHRIHRAIEAGETYQVNYTGRMRATVQTEPTGERESGGGRGTSDEGGRPIESAEGPFRTVYEGLRSSQGDGYHALLELDGYTVISASPELFFRLRGREVTVRPMKGTRPRGRWMEEDEALARELRSSEKEQAENRMIVDLLRNDLGRVVETGSVEVPSVFDVERYRTVLQMTSTIKGLLPPGADFVDVLSALFPSGSVTGAPKIRTMGIISDLETSPREVYCGTVGFVEGGSGDAVFNVPIRTLWIDEESKVAVYGTGSGVTWSSTAEHEFDEVRAKARILTERWPTFDLLESLRLEDGSYARLDRHLARMASSAAYFDRAFPEVEVRRALEEAAEEHREGIWKVRLLLSEEPRIRVDVEPLLEATGGSPAHRTRTVVRASAPVDSSDRWLFHKTTHRRVYDRHRREHPDAFDVLLHNERGHITEFTRGNVVLELEDRRVTPPRSSGLLAGCFRQELLDSGAVVEAPVPVPALQAAERLWLVNSVRGWVPVTLGKPDREGRGTGEGQDPGNEQSNDGIER